MWHEFDLKCKETHSEESMNPKKASEVSEALVHNSTEISNISLTPKDLIDTHQIMTLIIKG